MSPKGLHATIALVALASAALAAQPSAPLARTIRGQPVKTGNALHPKVASAAGTPLAMRIQKTIDAGKLDGVPSGVIVEGPGAFSEEARRPPPKWLKHVLNKAYIWTKWQLAGAEEDKRRLRGPATHFQHPLLTANDARALFPQLEPGDIIVNGIGGIATHVSQYIGGGQIVHALGTPATQQSYAQVAGNVVKLLSTRPVKIGVVQEGLDEFFARFERDTFFVVRDPRMTGAMRAKGVAHVKTLVGRGYDYDMNQTNDTMYCTEIATETLRAAYEGSGLPLPAIGTTAIQKNGLEDFPMTPDNLLACPDFEILAASETGWKHLVHVVETHVLGSAAR
jgi:hypothetical protein